MGETNATAPGSAGRLGADLASSYRSSRQLDGRAFYSLCYAPFLSLFFHTDGRVTPCCKNEGLVLGHVQRDRIADLWTGDRVAELRDRLRRDDLGMGCEHCLWQIRSRAFGQVFAKVFDQPPAIDPEPALPRMLQLALSNRCNLACLMCNGTLSSRIRRERDGLPPFESPYGARFFSELDGLLEGLDSIELFGGEPLVQDECRQVLDRLVERDLRVRVHLTTNGTVYSPRVERWLTRLPMHVSISVDGATVETIERIRVHARGAEVRANVRRFVAAVRGVAGSHVDLTYCLIQQNWHEFGPFLEWAEGLGVTVFVNTVTEPDHCSLYSLETDPLREIVSRMRADEDRFARLDLNGQTWSATLDALEAAAEPESRGRGHGLPVVAPDAVARARRRLEEGDPEGALELCRSVAESDPRCYEAAVLAGRALARLGKLEAALEGLDRAVERHPAESRAYVERSWVHLLRGDPAAARTDADCALERLSDGPVPNHLRAYALDARGMAARWTGSHDSAVADCEEACRLLSDNPWLRVHLAEVLLAAGRRQEAAESARRALAMAPDLSAARELLIGLGDTEDPSSRGTPTGPSSRRTLGRGMGDSVP